MRNGEIESLQAELRRFAIEREWLPFHTPKNLVMALAGEIGELAEIFQWLTPEESEQVMVSEPTHRQVAEEIADIFGYILRLADVLELDLTDALRQKIEINRVNYPTEKARGNAAKYSMLG